MPKRSTKKPPPSRSSRGRAIVPAVSIDDAVDQVEQWIVAGHRDREIARRIGSEFPQFEADVLYQAAVLKLSQNANLPDGAVFGFCIAATMSVYHAAKRDGEHKIALDAIKQLAALQKAKPTPVEGDEEPEGEPVC